MPLEPARRVTRAETSTRVDDDDGDGDSTEPLGRASRGQASVGWPRDRLSLNSQRGASLTAYDVAAVVAVAGAADSGVAAAVAASAAAPLLRTVRALTPSRRSSSPGNKNQHAFKLKLAYAREHSLKRLRNGLHCSSG